ncbi:late nodulin [Medicago truncatula]|uniref:Late nodulin n=2 Tax=Medicago truncatula TaxID=3880 RepID=A0A072UA50_MEDTR|nr:late nodulin [Medicago truncatula]
MAEILKFIYNAILFVSLYFIVIYGELVCDTDDDCLKFFPDNPYPMECINSICLSLTD